MHDAHEIDVHHALEQRGVGLGKWRRFRDARIGDQDIDRLACRGSGDRRADRGLIGNVGDIGEMGMARSDGLVKRGALAADHRDGRASAPANCAAIARPMPRPPPVTSACGERGSPDMRWLPMDTVVSAYILYFKLLQESGGPVSIAP